MRFFVDFEATQFSNRIISIGCVCENGNTFSTLVKPGKKKDKVTKFITDLTGITNEMLASAPSADKAFNMFFDFVIANTDGTMPEYFCYGNGDQEFISSTIRCMNDIKAITFATSIQHTLVDYSKAVKQVFGLANEISLKKIYTMVKEEEIIQHHDALEDALMLFEVVSNLKDEYSQEEKDKLCSLRVSADKPGKARRDAPDTWLAWNGCKSEDKFIVDTGANENDYTYYCVCNNNKKYFHSLETAALWAMRFGFVSNRSPRDNSHVQGMVERITHRMNTDKAAYNCKWYRKEE